MTRLSTILVGAGGGGSISPDQVWDGLGDALSEQPSRRVELAQRLDRRTIDPMTGVGWDALGGGTVVWGSGVATLSIPASAQDAVIIARSEFVENGDEWDLIARVQVTTGDGSAATRINLVCGRDNQNLLIGSLWGNGTVELARVAGGAFGGLGWGGTDINDAARTGGNLWLRLHGEPGELSFLWAVSSTIPSGWKKERTSVDPVMGLAGRYTQVSLSTTDSSVGTGFVARVLAVQTRATPQL